jgi:choice-of-anchor C domain-containing protein
VKRRSILGAVIAMLAAIALPGATLAFSGVTNGSFEAGTYGGGAFQTLSSGATNITGWTVGGAGIDWINTYWTAEDGSKSLDMNAFNAGTISQDLATTANDTYVVSFYLAGNPVCAPAVKTLTVSATGATSQAYTFDTTGHATSALGWLTEAYSFVATGTSTTLTFTSTTANSACGPALDNVSVTVQAPPPPSDTTAPTITYTQSPDGGNDWFKTAPATVTVTATDADDSVSSIDCTLDGSAVTLTNTSGIGTAPTASGEISTLTDGDHVVSCTATDSHSNTTAPAVTTDLKLDATAPVIGDVGFASGTAGLNGWYTSAVTENFTALDATSGLADCSATFSKDSGTSEGSAVTIASGSCSDNAGNTAPSINSPAFKIDLSDPYDVTFVGGPSDGVSYSFGSVPAAPTCTASDRISGFDHCTVTGYSTTVGSHTLTATAYDVAGRSATATLSYTVLAWTLHGFYQPVDMLGRWNTVKGGSTVPLKFNIFAGSTELKDTADVQGFTATPATCPNGSATTDSIAVTATGGTSLRSAGQFVYNWQTPKKAGACYVITMTTLDGYTLSANFILK